MGNYQTEPMSKVQIAALSHYARKDVQAAMFEFCKGRETVANFNNKYFSKRPDTFDYPSDVLSIARTGATSFHCSEEIWKNPMDIDTNMTPAQYNEIKAGWDLLIDIDSPYLDYGKIALRLLLETLEKHGVKNYGIKFSGSKGFHLIVPFAAFPIEVRGKLTKDHFPEWARYIAKYLFDEIKDPMNSEILGMSSREKLIEVGELTIEKVCPKCQESIDEKIFYKYKCPDIKCKTEIESPIKKKSTMICPSCNAKMERVSERKTDFCKKCKISTVGLEIKKSKMQFKEEQTIKSQEDSVDFVLVASRHLFRAPYSLHEKTAFASIPLRKDEIENFKPSDAEPIKIVKVRDFMPKVEPNEAENLLLHSIEKYYEEAPKEMPRKYEGGSIDVAGLAITDDMFPPIIKKLLKGIPTDGRKRALGLLLSFFTSLEFPQDYIEERIREWNKKNYQPIKEGYIRAQIMWALKNKRLPPNYDKPIYKEFGITSPPEPGMKNPINYTLRKAMRAKGRASRKEWKSNEMTNSGKKFAI
ncbi:hypothetical protein KAS08_01745 [Candidatus Pacearchaeota archaeon]|nr:hypothetical protein [Candidatus Pacearchaeota archaeon]